MVPDLTINISHGTDSDLKNFLQQKIRDYNNQVSPHHKAVREDGAIKPVNITVKNSENEIIAGIYSETYWGWLDISFLWVAEEFRSQGIGTKILGGVEDEAKKYGCSRVKLTTFSFQARVLYKIWVLSSWTTI